MEITIQRAGERGTTRLDWLHSRHSFSFGNCRNPKKINFGLLRVFNDDLVSPSKGFGMHSHSNMEIVSIVLEGTLEHKDNMGNHGIIKTGEVQRMSAGSGVVHSEFNASKTQKVHFLQIWIVPREINIKPSYQQKNFSGLGKDELLEVVSPTNKDSIHINQDAYFFIGHFYENKKVNYELKKKSDGVYVFVIEGSVTVDKEILNKGDTAEITAAQNLKLGINKGSKILLLEFPLQ